MTRAVSFLSVDLDRDLNVDPKRLDYIYYRNATPLNYVCNSKKYDGYDSRNKVGAFFLLQLCVCGIYIEVSPAIKIFML